jgi:hypothetical protein
MITHPGVAGYPSAGAHADAKRPESTVQRLVERRPADVPPVPEGIAYELGALHVDPAPGAAVAERGPVLLGVEHRDPEDVVEHRVGARRQALSGSRPGLRGSTKQLDV